MNKNQQVLAYISKNHPRATITVFMKLCYLIDLVSCKKTNKQILDYGYRRYKYGPFDNAVYNELYALRDAGIVSEGSDFTPTGEEFTYYCLGTDAEEDTSLLKTEELSVIDEVLASLKGYSAKTLTEVCYKTKPMKALGATLGGSENLNKKLDLSLVN